MNNATPPPPPPGWYADPNGSARQRWWDGHTWGPFQPEEHVESATIDSSAGEAFGKKSKRRSAAPGLILSFVAFLGLFWPELTVILGLIAFVLSMRVLKNDSALKMDRTNAKIAIGFSVIAIFLGALVASDSPGPKETPSSSSTRTPGGSAEEPFDPTAYKQLGEREFALLSKSPDDHEGEKILIHGEVTQFDSNTGECAFRADTDALLRSNRFEYKENTFITGGNDGTCSYLKSSVVAGDSFRAWVKVDGSLEYKTQIGGVSTALKLVADKVEVI